MNFNKTRFGNRIQHQNIFDGKKKVKQNPAHIFDGKKEAVEQEPVGDIEAEQNEEPQPTRKSKRGHIPKNFGPEYMVGNDMDQAIEDDEVNFALNQCCNEY